MHISSALLLPLVFLVPAAVGIRVQFFTPRSCAGAASEDYRNLNCNTCVDPPFSASPLPLYSRWGATQFSELGGNNRVTIHNQNGCSSRSQVGQGYGNVCFVQGSTGIQSAWVACPGQEAEERNITEALVRVE
ncbi:hypothetical protein EVG20_g6206 [Dentipellis fragilis]|uniref:Uncharacterized protein n=1 Tax=Dentipellis fragilis TaxID=205917 RepID=A0A4Y9YNI3_9AGAM|nr:hypothetical protein EVG20_g6206 [Dentipellis fragilis]